MTEPREFLVLQSLQTALRAIRTTDGYHHTVNDVAVKLDPDHEVKELIGDYPERPLMFLEISPDEAFEYSQADQLMLLMRFRVHGVDNIDLADDDAQSRTHFRLCADIETAIAADHSRGGKATDTRIIGREMHELDPATVWSIVSGEVRLHRTYGAPNG